MSDSDTSYVVIRERVVRFEDEQHNPEEQHLTEEQHHTEQHYIEEQEDTLLTFCFCCPLECWGLFND